MTLDELLDLVGIISTAAGHPEVPAIIAILQRLIGSMQAAGQTHVSDGQLADDENRVAIARARAIAAGAMMMKQGAD